MLSFMEITKINFDENTLRDIKNNLVALNLTSFANIIDDAEQVIFGGSTIVVRPEFSRHFLFA
jgi:hypothetical protein